MDNPYLVPAGQPLASLTRPDAISASTRAVNQGLAKTLALMTPPAGLAEMRDAYVKGLLGLPASPKSPRARRMAIDGPAGPIELRVFVPDDVRGVYLHIHGGGWIAGSNDTWDEQLELFGREAGMVAVSLDYRLAPEHPAPAAVEDCVAVASWLIEHAGREFGTSWLSIGGESAGSNLAALTLLRLRDLGQGSAYRAASLLFGCFDLSLTPSVYRAQAAPFVSLEAMRQFTAAFAGGTDLRDPAISPLYADLHGLPPALFSVGSVDPLLDDSLFMHMRWQAAGNDSYLAVYPGGTHGFNSFAGELAAAGNRGIATFLAMIRRQAHA
ncbi:alpha/beta hydrolase [Azospirillum picis]|uniref:Acetyl esterase/lipase n=1 Tax=Azospirillum picis TaxID=488438 RepID=A0ABU0MQQ9_9PROT|nr:alpha/beta hydrolase [Azospirillum picis]MBP2302229.1 acetyl esterase/lipase [Azospirillum picis]MDQ0535808.1 acetyl esterase/lipase [Azospirillum picis]